MIIEITEEQRDILIQTINITNYPGEIAEKIADLKKTIREAAVCTDEEPEDSEEPEEPESETQ